MRNSVTLDEAVDRRGGARDPQQFANLGRQEQPRLAVMVVNVIGPHGGADAATISDAVLRDPSLRGRWHPPWPSRNDAVSAGHLS